MSHKNLEPRNLNFEWDMGQLYFLQSCSLCWSSFIYTKERGLGTGRGSKPSSKL